MGPAWGPSGAICAIMKRESTVILHEIPTVAKYDILSSIITKYIPIITLTRLHKLWTIYIGWGAGGDEIWHTFCEFQIWSMFRLSRCRAACCIILLYLIRSCYNMTRLYDLELVCRNGSNAVRLWTQVQGGGWLLHLFQRLRCSMGSLIQMSKFCSDWPSYLNKMCPNSLKYICVTRGMFYYPGRSLQLCYRDIPFLPIQTTCLILACNLPYYKAMQRRRLTFGMNFIANLPKWTYHLAWMILHWSVQIST